MEETKENLKQLISEAKNCHSCLEWHKHCNAECCRMFSLSAPQKWEDLKEGDTVHIRCFDPPSMKWYYALHGARYERGIITVKLGKFHVNNGMLHIMRTCDYLTEENKCKGHPDSKPKTCRELNLSTCKEKRFVLTPNCMFKYQLMGEINEQDGNSYSEKQSKELNKNQ